MKTFQLFIPLFLFSLLGRGQTVRPEIDKIVNQLLSYEYLYHKCIGRGCNITRPYRLFLSLQKNATIQELLTLTKHDTTRIKGYAAWALANRKYKYLDSIFIQFSRSGETVFYAEGDDYPIKDYIAHEFYYNVRDKLYDPKVSKSDKAFFANQIRRIKDLGTSYSD